MPRRRFGRPAYVSVALACRRLGVHRTTVYAMLADGRLAGHRQGVDGPYRIVALTVEALAASAGGNRPKK